MYVKKFAKTLCALPALLLASATQASIVRMETSLGNIDIELFDTQAPVTVANFMNYVNDGDFVNSFFHRLVPGFVLQGGGFTYQAGVTAAVPADAPIVNEFDPSRSNVRGTLAMAKLAGDPNSATSEWFFNLADNSANLDTQNGGFTVFGQVIGNGMDVVDAIAALRVYNLGSQVFSSVPLNGYVPGSPFTPETQLVYVNQVSTVPVPPAAWLFAAGLAGLVGVTRRGHGK